MKAPRNNRNEPIIVGCNYHTTWQSDKGMRFVLHRIIEDDAYLKTRRTGKFFKTNVNNLIFIRTGHNIRKGVKFLNLKQ